MKNQHREQAPSGAVPPIIPKPQVSHVCIFPAKEKPVIPKPMPPPPPEPKPERTLEQRVADEVERRLSNQVGAFALGFFVGEMVEQSWHKHHKDWKVTMNAELKALHLASRIATSAKMCAAPEEYKVCWVCLSIAYQRAPLCPVCHAHRFYQSADAVRVVAGMMERVAFPVTAGTVPRFGGAVREQPKKKEVENDN